MLRVNATALARAPSGPSLVELASGSGRFGRLPKRSIAEQSKRDQLSGSLALFGAGEFRFRSRAERKAQALCDLRGQLSELQHRGRGDASPAAQSDALHQNEIGVPSRCR